ncbi:MAG: PH domain-containing protein [Actinomycetota bacterium]
MPEPQASEPPPDQPTDTQVTAPETPKQLHAAAVPIWLMYDAGRFFFALIPAILLGGIQPALLVAVPFIVGASVVRFRRFHYQLTSGTLMVEGGLINRWRRVIPRERVQSVDVVEKLRHRAFGVVEVRVEAIGAQETEAALVALSREEAERIKGWASGGGPVAAGVEGDAERHHPVLARLTPTGLVLAGITGGRVAVLAVLLGYAQEFLGEQTLQQARSLVQDLMPSTSLVAGAAILVAALILTSLVLSVIATVLVHWDFTLILEDDRLVITRGLLERRRAQIPLRRIQAVEIHENLLRKVLGLASLTVVVAGYNQEGQHNDRTNVLLPIGRRKTTWSIAAQVLRARSEIDTIALEPRPRRALSKNLVLLTLPLGVAGTIATLLGGAPGAFVFLLLPLGWVALYLGFKVAGHGINDECVIVRGGVVVTTTSIVPMANLQHLQMSWSALQERYGLATIRVHIPRSAPRARDMDKKQAAQWFKQLGAASAEI